MTENSIHVTIPQRDYQKNDIKYDAQVFSAC